jgi:hypothetical protein
MENKPASPRPNILANIDKIVKDEIAKGAVPTNDKWVLIATYDNDGTKILAAANFKIKDDKIKVQTQAIWSHDWDGNDSIAGKVIFSGK